MTEKIKNLGKFSPKGLIALIALIIFAMEIAIMAIFMIVDWPEWVKTFVDATSLTVVLYTILKIWVFTPLLDHEKEMDKFKMAVDDVSDHILITDPDGKIIYFNKAASKITGYSLAEVLGKTPAIWGNNMPKEFYAKMWDTIKNKKQVFSGEVKNKRKSGEEYIASLRISPVTDISGALQYFVGVERDITNQKKVEAAKNEFVSLASHQLRTPLTSINWYSEMLLDGDAGKLNESQAKHVGEIYSASKRMAKIVNAFLNISRIELGTFSIVPEDIDLKKIIDVTISDLKKMIEKKGIVISEDLPAKLSFRADPNVMHIIIQNLISNAVKYTYPKGSVKISAENVGGRIKISVSDTGCGISVLDKDKIFTKLFRADNARNIDPDGNGLGLYMVKSILDEAGGSISFKSEEGKGTTFTVNLPEAGMLERHGTRSLVLS